MGRKKLVSVKAYDIAKARLAGLKSIDPNLDLGNGLTVDSYEKAITIYSGDVGQYNTTLSTVDDQYNSCKESLLVLKDQSERMLTGVASKYGKNSSQYEMAGGKKKSDRKKPVTKTAAAKAN